MGKLNRAMKKANNIRVLFQAVKTVSVSFNPFDLRTTSAREFLKRAEAAKASGLKNLVVSTELYSGNEPPRIKLEMHDGAKKTFLPAAMTIREVTDEMEKLCRWRLEGRVNPWQQQKN